jgi:HSP20 family protein
VVLAQRTRGPKGSHAAAEGKDYSLLEIDASAASAAGKEDQEGIMAQSARNIKISKQPESPAPLKLVPPTDLFKRAEQIYEKIARRAFEIFESNGPSPGHDLEDWFKAESELLHPVHVDVAESNGDLTVRAEVPGFAAKELEVSVEPRRLTITGKRETKGERKDKKTVYTECSCDQLLRVIDLPAAVETEKAEAILKNGVLELKMPKAPQATKVPVTAKESSPDREC